MPHRNVFLIACMLAPSAGLPDSSYTTRHRRPAARGGPTRDGRLVPYVGSLCWPARSTFDGGPAYGMTWREGKSECVVARGVGGLGENDAGADRRAGAAGDGQARLVGEKALV